MDVGTGRAFKDAIYEQFSRIGKALSNPRRLELLELLSQAERSVEVLAEEANLSLKSTSQHLQVLRAAKLVEARRKGLFVTYRIADPQVMEVQSSIRLLAERRLAEIERITQAFLQDRAAMEPVDEETLLRAMREGEVVLIDVRPTVEYLAGHIAGAVSMPIVELQHRLSELPQDKDIVAYCRGPYCVLAVRAVELLRARGFRAARLADGVHEWRRKGLSALAVGARLS